MLPRLVRFVQSGIKYLEFFSSLGMSVLKFEDTACSKALVVRKGWFRGCMQGLVFSKVDLEGSTRNIKISQFARSFQWFEVFS